MLILPRAIIVLVLVAAGGGLADPARAQDAAQQESAVDAEIAAYAACGARQAAAIARSGASRGFAAVEPSLSTACRAEIAALRQALLNYDVAPEAVPRALRTVQARVRPQLRAAFDAAALEARRQREPVGSVAENAADGEGAAPAVPPVASAPAGASVPLPLPRPRELEVPPEATASLRAEGPSNPPAPTDGPVAASPTASSPPGGSVGPGAPAATSLDRPGSGAAGLAVERTPDASAAFVARGAGASAAPAPAMTVEGLNRAPVSIGGIGVATLPIVPPEGPAPAQSTAGPPVAAEAPPTPVERAESVEGVTRVARIVPPADRVRLLDSAIGLHRVCLARAVLGLKPGLARAQAMADVVAACRPQQEARVAREIEVDGAVDPLARQRIERDVAEVTGTETAELMTLLRGGLR